MNCKYLTDDSFFTVNCLDALNFNLAKVVSFNKWEYELSRAQHLTFGWVELTLWHVRVDISETRVYTYKFNEVHGKERNDHVVIVTKMNELTVNYVVKTTCM